jgi:hypothetical protein
MYDLKSRINLCSTLASASLLFITPHCFNITSSLLLPPLASNIQKVTHHLLEEVEEAYDDNRDMTYSPEEEDHEEKHCRNDRRTP